MSGYCITDTENKWRHLPLRHLPLNGQCPTQIYLWSSSPQCDCIWREELQRVIKGNQGHKYRAVIGQDLGWWLCEIETNEEKCIMYMHIHWGKPRGGLLWHHLWARKMALFRTNYNGTLWENEYRCLSPLSVVFSKASLGMPGHHYFGYLSLPCFLWLSSSHRDGTILVAGFTGHSWRNQAAIRLKIISLGFRVIFDSPPVLAAQTKVFVNMDVTRVSEGPQRAIQRGASGCCCPAPRTSCLPFFGTLLFLLVSAFPISHTEWALLSFHPDNDEAFRSSLSGLSL